MSDNLKKYVLIIGAGSMAIEYAKVLNAIDIPFKVVCRNKQTAEKFYDKMNIMPETGGLAAFITNNKLEFTEAIIATEIEQLADCTKKVEKHITSKILIEKPAGKDYLDAITLKDKLNDINNIYVAYNRRFYKSVEKCLEIIEQDGGLLSFHFEFTEWIHIIENLNKTEIAKRNWFFANSTHIVDLAFYLAGAYPDKMTCMTRKKGIDWHPYSIFTGTGITQNNILFTYHSNWLSAGRWAIELMTSESRIYLKPIEELYIQKRGMINIEKIELKDEKDKSFMPGLYEQVVEFLYNKNSNKLLSLSDHVINIKKIYSLINP